MGIQVQTRSDFNVELTGRTVVHELTPKKEYAISAVYHLYFPLNRLPLVCIMW